MKEGAIVRIVGLQSETGKQMNDKPAEVIEIQERIGRIGVAMTLGRKIKIASIKSENLVVELSVFDAIKKSVKIEKAGRKKTLESDYTEEERREIEQLRQRLPSLSAAEVVHRIRQGDKVIFATFVMLPIYHRELPKLESAGVMQALGLVDSALAYVKYPDAIDYKTNNTDKILSQNCLNVLDSIFMSCSDSEQVVELCEDIVSAIGPAILCCCTKRRRISGRTDSWWITQAGLLTLLYRCLCSAHDDYAGSFKLIKSIDPYVTDKLMEMVVFNLTADPKIFLQVKSPLSVIKSQIEPSSVTPGTKIIALAVLAMFLEFSARGDDGGEALAQMVGRRIVQPGSPLTGRHFAECCLDWAAHMGLAEYPVRSDFERVEYLQLVYLRFDSCTGLSDLVDERDEEFISLKIDSALKEWAKARLNMAAGLEERTTVYPYERYINAARGQNPD